MFNMKKIIIFGNNLNTTLRFRGNTIKYLIDKGYEVRILAPFPEKSSLPYSKAPVTNIQFSERGISVFELTRVMIRFLFLMMVYRPNYIFCYGIKCSVISSITSILLPVKNITFLTGLGLTFSDNFKYRFVRTALVRFVNFYAKRIIVINKEDEILMGRMIPSQKVVRFPGEGIDPNEYKYQWIAPLSRTIDFLYLGRFEEDKGFKVFCDAILQLGKEGFRFNAAVAGGGSQIDYLKKADFAKTSRNFTFTNLGYIKNVQSLLSQTKFLVLPSPREGIPRSLMEAMSVGTVCIGTNVPGIKDLLTHEETGFLFPSNQVESVKNALVSAMNLDAIRYKKVTENARKLIEEKYRQDLVDLQYCDLLRNL